jgi:glycosyltransferase involved in cell wall biosynthesis
MKRVLIICPHFPPIALPDMQRVRMALPFMSECGWEPLVLKIDPEEQAGIKDPLLAATISSNVRVWQAGCIPLALTRWAGLRNAGLRSFFHIAALGSRIIETEKSDVIFFSTTTFLLFVLGPYWLRKHGCPYILDFQDPWVNDYPAKEACIGQRFKRWVMHRMAKLMEPWAVRAAAHIICVSPAYPDMIRQRYPDVASDRFSVLPFAAAESDFEVLDRHHVVQSIFAPRDGNVHWVYVGVCPPAMAFALRSFFNALRRARAAAPESVRNLRVHFVGTSYAPDAEAGRSVEPIAIECGVGDLVIEQTQRIPYFEALQCLRDADALIVPGSDAPGYTASKHYPYILAKKPLLAIFHEKSSVVQVLAATQAGTVVTFNAEDSSDSISTAIFERWFCGDVQSVPSTNWSEFQPYTARAMTIRLCECFDDAILARGVTPC